MISAAKIKRIASLKNPKFRELYSQTLAEGSKIIRELLDTGFPYLEIFATDKWSENNTDLSNQAGDKLTLCSEKELGRMSALRSPQGVIALLEVPQDRPPLPDSRLTLYCDRISDPGNMGTILRIADWFGIDQVISSPGSVNLYSPKVVQASMGSVFRVHSAVMPLPDVLNIQQERKPEVYAAVMDGERLTEVKPSFPAIIVIGNESEGISSVSLALCTRRVTIPAGRRAMPLESAESLNAAIATALFCHHFTNPD